MEERNGSFISFKRSHSCKIRPGSYGLSDIYTRTNSMPTATLLTLSSDNSEIFPSITCKPNRSRRYSRTSTENMPNYKVDTLDYVSNFNSLTLGENAKSLDFHFDKKSKSSKSYLKFEDCDTASNNDSFYTNDSYSDCDSSDYAFSTAVSAVRNTEFLLNSSNSEMTDVVDPFMSCNDDVVHKNQFQKKCVVNNQNVPLVVFEEKSSETLFAFFKSACFGILRIFIVLAICCISIFVLILFVSIYIQYQINTCTVANNLLLPINSIENNLTQCLIGQEVATSVLSNTLRRYNYEKINLGLLWLVGPVGVGKTRSLSLIQETLGSEAKLHLLYGSLLPSEPQLIQNAALELINNLDLCKPNIIMYDEFDNVNIGSLMLTTIFTLLKREGSLNNYGVHMKIFILLSGTYKHEYIIESYVKHFESGGIRQNYDYEMLRKNLLDNSPFKNFPFLDITLVPFLPLEEQHLIMCINQELNFFLEKKLCSLELNHHSKDSKLNKMLKTKKLSLQYIYSTVKVTSNVSLFNFKNVIITSGCKRVQKTVNLLLTSFLQ